MPIERPARRNRYSPNWSQPSKLVVPQAFNASGGDLRLQDR